MVQIRTLSSYIKVSFILLAFASGPPLAGVATAAPATATPRAAADDASLEAPAAAETFTVGSLRVQRYGDRGRPLILIPGMASGSWVWREQIERFRAGHVIYAVTLAGFDRVPFPESRADLIGQADCSLLALIRSRHLDKPVLIGHSLGGGLSIRFAVEHSDLIAGLISVDGPPIFPGMERLTPAERAAFGGRLADSIAHATPEQYLADELQSMKQTGTLDPIKAERYAPLNIRSDQSAVAQYVREGVEADFRPGLKNIHVPLLEISPYYAPDFSEPPLKLTETEKTESYRRLLAGAPHAQVLSISPSRHYVMFDQPARLDDAIAAFLESLAARR